MKKYGVARGLWKIVRYDTVIEIFLSKIIVVMNFRSLIGGGEVGGTYNFGY